MKNSRPFSVYKAFFLPGVIFLSVVMSGGYGTGRELAEYFGQGSPLGGFLGLTAVTALIWGAVAAVSFALVFRWRAYDYKSFFSRLLGRWWHVYEVGWIFSLVLVLAVIASASGEILFSLFSLPRGWGAAATLFLCGFIASKGEGAVSRFLSAWGFVLYAVFALLFALCFFKFGDAIKINLASLPPSRGWAFGGLKYALYNLGSLPPAFFAIKHARSTGQAMTAGALAGVLAVIPAALLFLCMLGFYPQIMQSALPINAVFSALGSTPMVYAFNLALLGTLVETACGMIFSVITRFEQNYNKKAQKPPAALAPVISTLLLLAGAVLSSFGLKDLIKNGYGAMTWVFLAVFALPVMTVGVRALARGRG